MNSLLQLLLWIWCSLAVSIADLTSASVTGFAINTLTTPAFTITANANRAGLLGLSLAVTTPTAISGSIGGVAGAAIAGTDSTTGSLSGRSLQFRVIAPPSGSQTATMSWTGATGAALGVVVTSGVDQTTPFNGGTFNFGSTPASPSLTITSTNGDLTTDTLCDDGTVAPATPNQTQLWALGTNVDGAGSRGPGTGTTTHTWSISADAQGWAHSGSNWNQAPSTGVTFDNQTSVTGSAVTTLTTPAFTITTQPNRAAVVGFFSNGASAPTSSSVGGVAGVAIPGTWSTTTFTWSVVAPPSGSQTATVNWTTAGNGVMGVATFYRVNQTTPVNGGTNSGFTSGLASSSVNIVSAAGDMTVDHCYITGAALSAPTQAQNWNAQSGGATGQGSASSRGPGTAGTITHTWTTGVANTGRIHDGVNLVQATTVTIVEEDGEWISLVQPA